MKHSIVKVHDSLYEFLVYENDCWRVVAHGKYESMRALENLILPNNKEENIFSTLDD